MTASNPPLTREYSSDIFHAIPDLAPQRVKFAEKNVSDLLESTVGPLIQKHGLEEVMGVGLIHRHFDLGQNAMLVEFNNVTVPWPACLGTQETRECSKTLYAAAWLLDQDTDRWMPYEQAYSPTGLDVKNVVNLDDPAVRVFVQEFTELVKHHGVQDLLGLRSWPGKGFRGGLEMTVGDANILLKPGEFVRDPRNKYTETMWFWAKEYVNANCSCVCGWKNGFHLMHDHVEPPPATCE